MARIVHVMTVMSVPLDIRYHNIDPSAGVAAWVRKELDKLQRHGLHPTSCRVAIDKQCKASGGEGDYHVTVDVWVPHHEWVASCPVVHKNLYQAVQNAFSAVGRHAKVERSKTRRAARHVGGDGGRLP